MFTEGEWRGRVELLRDGDLHRKDEGRPRVARFSLEDRLGLKLCLHVHPDTGLATVGVGGVSGLVVELGCGVTRNTISDIRPPLNSGTFINIRSP